MLSALNFLWTAACVAGVLGGAVLAIALVSFVDDLGKEG